MARYIDADEYVIIPIVKKMDDEPSQLPITIGDLIKRITKKEPIFADVREVVHGKWLSHYDYCEKHGYIPSGLTVFWWCDQCEQGVEHPTNFCPTCGADMRGVE